MPLWRDMVEVCIRMGILSKHSGVFLAESNPPFEEIKMTHFKELGKTDECEMTSSRFIDWMGGPR